MLQSINYRYSLSCKDQVFMSFGFSSIEIVPKWMRSIESFVNFCVEIMSLIFGSGILLAGADIIKNCKYVLSVSVSTW